MFNMIDTRLILEGRPLQEQFYITSHFIQDKIFVIKLTQMNFTPNLQQQTLIDPRHSFKVQCNADNGSYAGFIKSTNKLL